MALDLKSIPIYMDADSCTSFDWAKEGRSVSFNQLFCVDLAHNPAPVLVSRCNHPDCIAFSIHSE